MGKLTDLQNSGGGFVNLESASAPFLDEPDLDDSRSQFVKDQMLMLLLPPTRRRLSASTVSFRPLARAVLTLLGFEAHVRLERVVRNPVGPPSA